MLRSLFSGQFVHSRGDGLSSPSFGSRFIAISSLNFAQIRRKHRQPRLRHTPLLQQSSHPGTIGSRPGTPGTPGSKAPRVSLLVNSLIRPIDPAKAKSLLHRLLIRDARLSRAFLVVNEPDFLAIGMVLGQPSAPLLPRGN